MIVIALLGVIALIVIAAINPIEQANRARDTQFKADGAQLISAIDRYFAANQQFPWSTVTTTISSDAAYGFVSAQDPGIGICDATNGCSADGVLITSNELQTAFRSRNFISAPTTSSRDKLLWIGKEEGTSKSIYACYIPLATSNRNVAIANHQVYHISYTSGSRGTPTGDCDASTANWVSLECFVCIPE